MTTINLEKSITKQNRKLAIPEELLIMKEYDKFASLVEDDTLSRVGLNQTLNEGKDIKYRIELKREQTKYFAQERVFHISQIKAICKKYSLRFLETEYYKGTIDKELPNRISNLEIAYNLKCNKSNTKILAPLSSFKLEEKPKDPLMFYQINDEYFYLIHKWGNDLSLSRAILPFFENSLFCWFLILFTTFLLFFTKLKLIDAIIFCTFFSSLIFIVSMAFFQKN